jgi:hypothetical protein
VVLHTPAVENELDELDELGDLQIPKRRKIVELKMYVHFRKSAASFGNLGTTLVQNSSTLEQMLNQDSQTWMDPDMTKRPVNQNEK